MALTQEDLQAIRALLREEVQEETAPLKDEIKKLNQTVARIEVDHGYKLGALYDAHIDTVRNAATIQELDAKVEDHGHRILALEKRVSNG